MFTTSTPCGTTGRYASDGREYCACGSIANPAGFCSEHGTPIAVRIDGAPYEYLPEPTFWITSQVHVPCEECARAASEAITLARVMGSSQCAAHGHGNHAASVRRAEPGEVVSR